VNDGLIILLIAGMVALVIVGIIFGSLVEKKRREELTALASKLGLRFEAEADYKHEVTYGQFSRFKQGRKRYAHNRMVGVTKVGGRECRVVMGDYHYQTQGQKNQTHTHRFSLVLVHLPWTGVPGMVVRKEGVMDKMAGVFGFDDIDFESAEFSRRYYVKSADRKFAYAVISPAMIEHLLAADWPGLDLAGGAGLVASSSGRWDAAEFGRVLVEVGGFLDRWPRHVVAELEAAGRRAL
jgi:hypothetical protein